MEQQGKRVKRIREHSARSSSGLAHLKNAGAAGFIGKGISAVEFLDTIRAVSRGKEVVLLSGTLQSKKGDVRASDGISGSLFGTLHLTAREQVVFSLIIAGMSKAQIARRLHLTPRTLNRHLSRILDQINESGEP